LLRVYSQIELFVVDDVLAAGANTQTVCAGRDFADAFGPGVVDGLLNARRVLVWVKISGD
jgi:hypothetical protein